MTRSRTADQWWVREINLSIILDALRRQAPLSRAALARVTGLNKATVSSLVQELINTGFITEVGIDQEAQIGRPGRLLQLNPGAGRLIGAEIGVDFLLIVITDFAANLIFRHFERTTTQQSQAEIVERLITIIDQGLASTQAAGTVLGLALGVPGLVDLASGTLLFAPNLGWREVPLRALLQQRFPFPIFVGNEANFAALGESFFGAARGVSKVLYVSAGVGLGGGIVLDGQLLLGADGFGGEIGHMTLVPDGPQCNCGNRGCWETLVSQGAVFQRVREAIKQGHPSLLIELTGGDLSRLTIPLVVHAAKANDRVALTALEQTAEFLGIGIAGLVNALNPDIVVFGGILSLASSFLLPTMRHVITRRALPWSTRHLRLEVAVYGFDACVMGGIAHVYQQILNSPVRPLTESPRRRPSFTASLVNVE